MTVEYGLDCHFMIGRQKITDAPTDMTLSILIESFYFPGKVSKRAANSSLLPPKLDNILRKIRPLPMWLPGKYLAMHGADLGYGPKWTDLLEASKISVFI